MAVLGSISRAQSLARPLSISSESVPVNHLLGVSLTNCVEINTGLMSGENAQISEIVDVISGEYPA